MPHLIQRPSDFVSKVREITLLPEECLMSCDVTTLFTSVPIDPALNIIKDLLEKDDNLSNRTVLSVQNIIDLLGFCLHNTYFFQDKFYEQVEGTAMESSVSPIVANSCTWSILREKHSGLPLTPQVYGTGLWMTLGSFNNRPHKQLFLDHINSIDPSIKFMVKGNQGE